MTSLLGILKKNYGKTHKEKSEGLKLMEEARLLSEEIKLVYERMRWLKLDSELGTNPLQEEGSIMNLLIRDISLNMD